MTIDTNKYNHNYPLKEYIKMSLKWRIVMFSILGLWVLFWSIYSIRSYYKYQNELRIYKAKSMYGIIVKSKDVGGGGQSFEVKDNKLGVVVEYDLDASYDFEHNNIKVGDSLSKSANDKVFTFYKMESGKYKKCCEYRLSIGGEDY